MKFLHISDLHLGKRVHEFSMLEDQKYILRQILNIVTKEQPDGLLIAGDVYDKSVPPAEAVRVLDEFLTELAERNVPVFLVSGNHDSAERLAFGAQLMSSKGVYMSPIYDGNPVCVRLKDSYGEVCVHLLPFLRPALVRSVFGEEAGSTCQETGKTAIGHMQVDTCLRNVLVAHQFVTGASRCESEEVMVGGLDQMDAALFDDFDYVALGHIHSPQYVSRETIRYCGTPLKYSFSEAEQDKSVTVVELKEKGTVEIRTIPLQPLRDLRKIRGTYLEVTSRDFYKDSNTEDYLQITLTDEEDIPDGMQKLRIIYPNLMQLQYDNKRTRESRLPEEIGRVEHKSELELFMDFYEWQNNQPMSEEQTELAKAIIERIKEHREESV